MDWQRDIRFKLDLVGSNGLFVGSQTSDLDVDPSRNVAYVGSFISMGVAVVDITDRANPNVVKVLSTDYVGSPNDGMNASDSADVDIKENLLAVASQPADVGGFGGVTLYDITNPLDPELKGQFFTGGTHDVQIDPGYPSRPNIYAANFESTYDLSIIDTSNLDHPVLAASYQTDEPQGCTNPDGYHDFGGPCNAAHDLTLLAFPNGHTILYVAYWDSGFRLVDVTDPRHPQEIGKIDYTPGNGPALHWAEALAGGTCCAHYVQPTPSGRYVLTEDELGVGGAGGSHIYNATGCDGVGICNLTHLSDWNPPGRDVQASAIHATINTNGKVETNGVFQRFFTRDIHNLDVQEDQYLAPAYSSGVYLVDMHDKAHPFLKGFWQGAVNVKTACHGKNTLLAYGYQGDCFFQAREVWGAKFGDSIQGSSDFYIYASDFWDGLLVLRTISLH